MQRGLNHWPRCICVCNLIESSTVKTTMRTGSVMALVIMICSGCVAPNRMPSTYHGKPYQGKIQEIPGRLSCVRYDEGGEGIAYHDRERTNLAAVCCGSTFRVSEGVDVGVIADHHKSLSGPLNPKQNYVGWIFEGEWIKY